MAPRFLSAGLLALLVLGVLPPPRPGPQEVADRIVVRIENDILLLSDLQTLKSYQLLVDGKSEPEDQILERLIDQWIVRTEAEASRFPRPLTSEVNRALELLARSYGSQESFEKRLEASGLSKQAVAEAMGSQLYLSAYLESRFRPMARITAEAVVEFYEKEIVSRAKAQGQEPPSLEASRDSIEEALTQSQINQQADLWLKESRARLRIEKILPGGEPK